jgi:hypothetical protein
VVLTLTACGGSSGGEDVKKVAVDLVWANIHAQYGQVWARLHPSYQQVTTRAFWGSCQLEVAAQAAELEWVSVKATDAYPDRVKRPLLGTVPVTVVTIQAQAKINGKTPITFTDTNYWVKVGSSWRALWKPDTYAAYSARGCPATSDKFDLAIS